MAKKVALITGSSSGFGFELVGEFLRNDWCVIATLRNAKERQHLFDAYQAYHPHLTVTELDVTNQSDLHQVSTLVETQFSRRLDCLVNNAGVGVFGAFEDISEEQSRHIFEVNLHGVMAVTRALLPYLRQAQGCVINISSVLGYMAMPLTSIYCSSKYAVEGFTEALHYELSGVGVRVCLIEPGRFHTKFGDNSTWGKNSFCIDSMYRLQTENYKAVRDGFIKGKLVSPRPVARAVVKLAHMKNPPLRTICGKDAKLGWYLKRLLPECVLNRVLGKQYNKVLLKPKAT